MPEDSTEIPISLPVEGQPTVEVKPVSLRMIIDKGDLALYEEIGSKYDVRVSTISEEGQQYTHNWKDKRHRPQSHTGKVPEGKIYGEVYSTQRDLRDFWKELEKRKRLQA